MKKNRELIPLLTDELKELYLDIFPENGRENIALFYGRYQDRKSTVQLEMNAATLHTKSAIEARIKHVRDFIVTCEAMKKRWP